MQPLVLAIEPDLRQAAIIKRIVRDKALADVAVVDSLDAAIEAMRTAMPDVLLLSALLSPRDEDNLITHLKTLGHAGHLQTHTIPQLASALQPGEERASRGLLSAFRRKKGPAPAAGCDPDLFADEIRVFLQRAADKRRQLQNPDHETLDMRPNRAGAAPASETLDESPAAPSSSWSSPFEWKPSNASPAGASPETSASERRHTSKTPDTPAVREPSAAAADSLMAHLRPPAGIPSVEDLSAGVAPAFEGVAAIPDAAAAALSSVELSMPPAVDHAASLASIDGPTPPAVDHVVLPSIEALSAAPIAEVAAPLVRIEAAPPEDAAAIEAAAATIEVVAEIEVVTPDRVAAPRRPAVSTSIELSESLRAVAAPAKPVKAPAARAAQTSCAQPPATPDARPESNSGLGIRDRGLAVRDSPLGALATWARAEDRDTGVAATSDVLRGLLTALAVPASVVSVGYGRGCRIRRVRVPVAKEPPDSDVAGAVILSKRLLAEQREPSTA
ncbi:MAG: hypothetical protein ABIQ52_15355 [Vicinamibacterales bacterium]